MNLTTLPTPDLQFLIATARKELQSRKQFYEVCEYSHSCNSKGMFHKKQYKHWARQVENITDHHNAMAFEGTWLNIYKPNRVTQNDWILEYQGCKNQYLFFKAGTNQIITGTHENFISFRNECQKAFFYDK
jgi:hypothetical protein